MTASALLKIRLRLFHVWLQRETHRLTERLGFGPWITVLLGASLAFVLAMIVTVVLGGRTVDLILLSAGLSFVLGGGMMVHFAQGFGKAQTIEDLYLEASQAHWAALEAYRQARASRAVPKTAPPTAPAPAASAPIAPPEAVGVELLPQPSAPAMAPASPAAAELPAMAFPPGPLKMAPRLNSPNASPWGELNTGDAPPTPRRRRRMSLMPWVLLLIVLGGAAAVVIYVPRVREVIPFLKSDKSKEASSPANAPKSAESTAPKAASSKPESSLPEVKPMPPDSEKP